MRPGAPAKASPAAASAAWFASAEELSSCASWRDRSESATSEASGVPALGQLRKSRLQGAGDLLASAEDG